MTKNKIYLLLYVILGLSISFYLLSKIGQNISIQDKTSKLKEPVILTRKDVSIQTIQTGFFETSEGFIFAGGDFLHIRKGSHNATIVYHPKGNVLIDTGLGKNIDEQFDEMPSLLKPMFRYEKISPAYEVLHKNNVTIAKILMTHMHWDHASGLKDFTNVNIYTTKDELNFSKSDSAKAPAYLKSQYSGLDNFTIIQFTDGAYEIFDKSFDLYKDGSIVIVPLNGHSPGSIGIFVNLSKEKRYFFTGDLTWSKEGFDTRSHKFYISSIFVDQDRPAVEKEIVQVSDLLKIHPELMAIPAHDSQAFTIFEKLE